MARLNDLLRSHESSARLSLDQISQLESDLEKTRSQLAEAQEAGNKKVQVWLHSLSLAWHSWYFVLANNCLASRRSQQLMWGGVWGGGGGGGGFGGKRGKAFHAVWFWRRFL